VRNFATAKGYQYYKFFYFVNAVSHLENEICETFNEMMNFDLMREMAKIKWLALLGTISKANQ